MKNTKACVVLISYGIAIGLAVSFIWPFTPFRHTTKDWVDVLTAVGTLAAAVIALWLGLEQLLRRRRDDLDKAYLVLPSVQTRLRWTDMKIQEARTTITNWTGYDSLNPAKSFKELWDLVIAAKRLPPSTLDLIAIVPIFRRTALIAGIYSTIDLIDQSMHAYNSYFQNERNFDADNAGLLFNDWVSDIDSVIAGLNTVFDEIRDIKN